SSRSSRHTGGPRVGPGSVEAVDEGDLGDPGEPLAYGTGPQLADAVDLLQVGDARGEQLLQRAEPADQSVAHRLRQPRQLRQQPVAARADDAVEHLAAAEPERTGDRRDVEHLGVAE